MSAVVEAAQAAYAAGLSVVPPRQDGSKAPIGTWKKFQTVRASTDQMNTWYADAKTTGLGVVLGKVSQHAEMFELEGAAINEDIYQAFTDELHSAGMWDVWLRLVEGFSESTPKGGFHVMFHTEQAADSQKLAGRPMTAKEFQASLTDDDLDAFTADPSLRERRFKSSRVLHIETKGEAGFTINAPSNGQVHPSGRGWVQISGGFDTIATITVEQRNRIYGAARTLNVERPEEQRHQAPNRGDGDRPGDRYNADPEAQANVRNLLVKHGWQLNGQKGTTDHLVRPGKKAKRDELSATLGHYQNPPMLYVFSTSTVFEAEHGYTPFNVYTVLEHAGDYKAAAQALANDGYGDEQRHTEWAYDEEPGPLENDDLIGHIQPLDLATIVDLIQDDQWLVEPLIAYARRTVLQSKAGIGKSLLSLYIAACLATGKECLYRPAGEPVVVVYIDSEMTVDDLAERLDAMGFDSENDALLQQNLKYYLHAPIDPLDTETGAAQLVAVAQRDDARIVFIDTVTSQTEGDENSADTFRAMARLTTAKLTALGIASVLLDHLGKDTKKGGRGSSAKRDSADVIWTLTPTGDGLHLIQDKQRMGWVPQAVMLTTDQTEAGHLEFTIPLIQITDHAAKLLKIIEDLEIPTDAGRPTIAKTLKRAGIKFGGTYLQEAIRWRKLHPRTDRVHPKVHPQKETGVHPQSSPLSENSGNVDVPREVHPKSSQEFTPTEAQCSVPHLLNADWTPDRCPECENVYASGHVCINKQCRFFHWSHPDITDWLKDHGDAA